MKRYCFVFDGTLEEFHRAVERVRTDKPGEYLFDNDRGGRYIFGVARGGHSGGYWFVPDYTEKGGRLLIRGRIEYIDLNESKRDRIFEAASWVLLAPLWLTAFAIRGLVWLVRRMLHKPRRIRSEEKGLLGLMVEKLGCERIE